MAYVRFASLYDELMKEAPYDQWVEHVNYFLNSYQINGKKILDVGCGTGETAIRLSQAGYDVTGIDLSSEMLSIAENKAKDAGVELKLYEQDMTELEVNDQFDCIVIFCDSLNYLENKEQVLKTFNHVRENLGSNGLLLFDVHSLFKIHQGFINHDFSYTDDDIAYILECFEGPYPDSVYHDLTFFVKDVSGLYEKIEETHLQRSYSQEAYERLIQQAELELLEVCDFNRGKVLADTERLFFVAKKR